MESDLPSTRLNDRLRERSPGVADQVFARYAERLVHVAEQHLSRRLACRVGGEDVVQSVFRTFFRRAEAGEFRIDSTAQLWRLLVKITVLKTRAKARHHTAGMRNAAAEVGGDPAEVLAHAVGREPGPGEAAELVDQIEALLKDLPAEYAKALELRLSGDSVAEVATQMGLSRQGVYRMLNHPTGPARGGRSGCGVNSHSLALEQLTPSERAKLEHVLVEFDRHWRAGRIVEAVRDLPNVGWRRAAVVELVKIDLDRRWQGGKRPAVSHYLKQFPELGGTAAVPPELLQVEYQLREQYGPAPALAEYAEQYPAQVGVLESMLLATRLTMTPSQPYDAGAPTGGIPESFGRYRIQRQLGQGGMGTVYLAFDPQLEREVALKIPSSGHTPLPETTEQILREARAAAALHHPNICPVYDVGVIHAVPFITSLYVPGEPLSAVAKRRGELSDARVAEVVAQIARALEYAHGHGVIHRDLKPANIMMNAEGRPIVMDFGLARRVAVGEDAHATMSNAAGTPTYMAPEQVAATRAGPSSDIFSLGVVLFELLTGRRPFQGSPVEVFDQLLHEPLPSPSKFRPGIPPALEAVCVRATAKDPADRFPNMAAMADIPTAAPVPPGVPVIADRASDSDPLREQLAGEGFTLVAPHRKNRRRPRTADGRRLRRYKRRWIVERTFAWLHSYRRVVTRFEKDINRYDGFVHLACAFIALNRLL